MFESYFFYCLIVVVVVGGGGVAVVVVVVAAAAFGVVALLSGVCLRQQHRNWITLNIRGQCYKTFLSVINRFSYYTRLFVRLGWKSLPRTNTLAYYKNP